MTPIQWTQKTDRYWTATVEGYLVEAASIFSRANLGGFAYLAIFNPGDGIQWTCGTVNDLEEAQHAAEQMARRWAKGEG